MIDRDRLDKIISSLMKSNKNVMLEFYEVLMQSYVSIQTGLMSANDFNQVKYLQGFGSVLAVLIDSISKNLVGGEITDG